MMVILLITFIYLILCGMAYPLVLNRLVSRCPWGGHVLRQGRPDQVTRPCLEEHKPEAIVISIAGPVVIPFLIGSAVTNKTGREERRREVELKEAKHRKKLAQLEAERIAIMEKSLKE